jgi:hypothetical protein
MTEIPDPVTALRDYLLQAPDVQVLTGGRVFGGELPRDEVEEMPRKCILIEPSGSLGAFGRGYQEYGDQRFDVVCYAETPFEAHKLWRVVHPLLKQLTRAVRADCLLHWAAPAGGPMPLRDPDTDWPATWSAWQVLLSELQAA